jgi:aspartyl protease
VNINSLSPKVCVEVHEHHIYVPVRAGGRNWWFLLDTGAGASLFNMRVAHAVGALFGSPFTARGAGDAAVTGALLAKPFSAAIRDQETAVRIVGALPLDDLEKHEGHAIDGILGYDFLARHVIELDYGAEMLAAHDPDAFQYAGPGIAVPITMRHNHPHVQATLEVEPGVWVGGDFVIDIGSRLDVALTKPFAVRHDLQRRLGPTISSEIGRGVGGGGRSDVGQARALRAGDWIHPSLPVAIFGDGAGVFTSGDYFDGNIGGAVLGRYRLFIDYVRHRIIFEKGLSIT